VPTLPFIPSAVEMYVLRQIESGQASLPVLPGSAGAGAGAGAGDDARVRAARASMGGAVRRYAILATRALRRGETVGEVCVSAAGVLGLDATHARLAGLMHNVGEMWLLGVADRLREPARTDEVVELVRRYQAAASVQIAEHWGLPAEVVQACRDVKPRNLPLPTARLVRVGSMLAPSVEAKLDGGSAEWKAPAIAELAVSADQAQRIVEESVRALAAA
jgi:hypothetical protein